MARGPADDSPTGLLELRSQLEIVWKVQGAWYG
jgi:hypothetical protein